LGSNTQISATPPSTNWPALPCKLPSASPSTRAGSLVSTASARTGRRRFLPHLQRQAQQQFQPGGARFGLGEGQRLGIFVDRGVVGHQRVDGAVGQALAQRIAVALLAQRRRQAHAAVEVADVDVGQVQRVDADVAADGQALGLGPGAPAPRRRRC
jgi:hypothetical protein